MEKFNIVNKKCKQGKFTALLKVSQNEYVEVPAVGHREQHILEPQYEKWLELQAEAPPGSYGPPLEWISEPLRI